jgi:hypothetical protein
MGPSEPVSGWQRRVPDGGYWKSHSYHCSFGTMGGPDNHERPELNKNQDSAAWLMKAE